jgi:hypothetical protein
LGKLRTKAKATARVNLAVDTRRHYAGRYYCDGLPFNYCDGALIMIIGNYTFYERTRTVYPCGQILVRGMMDMGGYDEAAIVEIIGKRVTAWVDNEVIQEQAQ